MSLSLKKVVKKAIEYDNIIEQMQILNKHTKGYMFDSLVYRFKDYQAKAFQSEVNDYKYTHLSNELDARDAVKRRHNRDLMRFIEILNEAIGEHD